MCILDLKRRQENKLYYIRKNENHKRMHEEIILKDPKQSISKLEQEYSDQNQIQYLITIKELSITMDNLKEISFNFHNREFSLTSIQSLPTRSICYVLPYVNLQQLSDYEIPFIHIILIISFICFIHIISFIPYIPYPPSIDMLQPHIPYPSLQYIILILIQIPLGSYKVFIYSFFLTHIPIGV
jgi:hypothetical protein